ncbi:DUF2818 family protein [Zoogloea sp.]|uniref:DUF2818 family protein n=1 Tax=Zoogloea sp. TaxID=49181 RepID=UPI001AC65694|nr:DUF2818 family protein [Zoogloea sp.]MBN8281625.1 DUF2818 family protein [Zoogloea sp.]
MVGLFAVLAVLLVFANLPFLSLRFLGVVALASPKSGRLMALEVVLCVGLASACLFFVERLVEGVSYWQGWEFQVVLLCLFVVSGFPGFVHRFFWTESV